MSKTNNNNTITYTYDTNGNEIKVQENGETITENTYNARNELIKTVEDGVTITYEYDILGNRIEKTVGEATTQYFYEGNNVVLELNADGEQIAKNVYGIHLISRIESENIGYYFYNGHGDVVQILDSNGNLLNSYSYDDFGNIETEEEQMNNPFKYAGYYYDDETQNYYLLSRYYDPEIARFTSEDTYRGEIEDPLSLNQYVYARSNPLRYVDEDGHLAKEIWGAIEYVGKRVIALANAGVYFVTDTLKGTFNLALEVGNFLTTGDATKLKQLPGQMIQGIRDNFTTTFNWNNFTNYLNPNTEYDELVEYSKSVIQTGTTIYGGIKTISSISTFVKNITITPGGFTGLVYSNGMLASTYISPSISYAGNMSGALSSAVSNSLLVVGGNIGNYTLSYSDLQINPNYEMYQAKNVNINEGFDTFRQYKRVYGKAAKGKELHHIVEQSQIEKSGFDPKQIHNPKNIIEIDKSVHRKITAHYNSKVRGTNMTVREWLTGQSFEVQYNYGIKMLKEYGGM